MLGFLFKDSGNLTMTPFAVLKEFGEVHLITNNIPCTFIIIALLVLIRTVTKHC